MLARARLCNDAFLAHALCEQRLSQQAPGGPNEDGDCPYGGWTAPYRDPAGGEAILAAHGKVFDLLLSRRTYDIWAGFWPMAKNGPFAGDEICRDPQAG
jgi:hypothetical protein